MKTQNEEWLLKSFIAMQSILDHEASLQKGKADNHVMKEERMRFFAIAAISPSKIIFTIIML